ncbi:hypothetical protein JRY29_23190 [Salmonella enterica subsp. enterica serovar Kentucky]|nr:hypothetical protein JRY29_23190 [Salmonella enterica subsp. enterica serovar Kentucky]
MSSESANCVANWLLSSAAYSRNLRQPARAFNLFRWKRSPACVELCTVATLT